MLRATASFIAPTPVGHVWKASLLANSEKWGILGTRLFVEMCCATKGHGGVNVRPQPTGQCTWTNQWVDGGANRIEASSRQRVHDWSSKPLASCCSIARQSPGLYLFSNKCVFHVKIFFSPSARRGCIKSPEAPKTSQKRDFLGYRLLKI